MASRNVRTCKLCNRILPKRKRVCPDCGPMATKAQKEYIEGLTGKPAPENITKRQASELLDSLLSDRPATEEQLAFIEDLWGYSHPGMSARAASEYIDYLLEHQPVSECCGSTYNRHDDSCPSCGLRSGIYAIDRIPCQSQTYHESLWDKLKRFFRGMI